MGIRRELNDIDPQPCLTDVLGGLRTMPQSAISNSRLEIGAERRSRAVNLSVNLDERIKGREEVRLHPLAL